MALMTYKKRKREKNDLKHIYGPFLLFFSYFSGGGGLYWVYIHGYISSLPKVTTRQQK